MLDRPNHNAAIAARIAPGDLMFSLVGEPGVIGREWIALQSEAGTAFETADWFGCWAQTVGASAGEEPAILTARTRGGELMALLPLVIARRRGSRVAIAAGGSHAAYHRALVSPRLTQPVRWSEAWAHLADVDAISIDGIPMDASSCRAAIGPLRTAPYGWSYYQLSLEPDWDGLYEAKFGGKRRKKDRRKERALEATGELACRISAGGEDAAALASDILERKSAWLRKQRKADPFRDPQVGAFYRALARLPSRLGHPRAMTGTLTLDGDLIAASFGLVHRTTFHSLIIWTTETEARRHSPGSMLTRRMMQACCEMGLDTYDFGAGDQPHKLEYADQRVALGHAAAALNLRGMPAMIGALGSVYGWNALRRAHGKLKTLAARRA